MGEELRLGLRGEALVFPGNEPFCLVCGAAPARIRRVWFEEPQGPGGAAGDRAGALGTGVRAIANRVVFCAPLCEAHLKRARFLAWSAAGWVALALAIILAGVLILSGTKLSRSEAAHYAAAAPALIPGFFGYLAWRRKDRGGLPCEVRREVRDVVLVYPERAPKPAANT